VSTLIDGRVNAIEIIGTWRYYLTIQALTDPLNLGYTTG